MQLCLKKVLTFWEDRDASEESISENLDRLRDYYINNGFYFAGVTSRSEEAKAPPTITITFLVNEGPRVKLSRIIISGNGVLKTSEIKDEMGLKESSFFKNRRITKEAVAEDVGRIKALYEAKGFMKAEVSAHDIEFSRDDREASLKIDIGEGPRTYISGIKLTGQSNLTEDKVRAVLKVKAGEPLNPQNVKDDQNSILNLYSQNGYIHATVDVEKKISDDGRSAEIVYNISEGPWSPSGT